METTGWRLTRAELGEWLGSLLRDGKRVVAPVEDGKLRLFEPIESPEQASLASGKTRWSPKEFLFPKSETLFTYTVDADGVKLDGPAAEAREQVIFGVRPCDAAGLARLDAVFMKQGDDVLYAGRRARSTVVSLACSEADPECFCTAVGGSPGGETGSDLQLVPLGDAWLLRALTPKGEALAKSVKAGAATPQDVSRAAESTRRVEESIRVKPAAREWAAALESSFHLPLWEAVGQRCLGCSICNYVCPSCSCFDVNDAGNAFCGERCRSWDSCTFGLFTRHASGHNPRNNQPARFRQRVLHKFAYFPTLNEGQFMCVGCGRCVKMCPVGMDIRQSAQTMVAAAQEATDARR